MLFSKILIPVDGSDASDKAVGIAHKMIEEGSAKEITVLHVLQSSEVMPFNGLNMPVDYPQFYEELNRAARQILIKATESLSSKHTVTTVLEYGSPAEIICAMAERDQYDLIIIGNRGLNRFQRVLLGASAVK